MLLTHNFVLRLSHFYVSQYLCRLYFYTPIHKPSTSLPDISLHQIVEYQTYPSLQWKPCQFEASVVQQLLDTQFQQYLTRVKSTDCQAELKRLLKNGPPIYIHDRQAAAYNMNHLSQATMLCAPFSRLADDSTSSSDHSEVGCSEKGVEGHQEQEDFYFDDYEKIEATNSFGGDLGGIEVLYPSSSIGSTGSTTSSTDESSGVRRIEI